MSASPIIDAKGWDVLASLVGLNQGVGGVSLGSSFGQSIGSPNGTKLGDKLGSKEGMPLGAKRVTILVL